MVDSLWKVNSVIYIYIYKNDQKKSTTNKKKQVGHVTKQNTKYPINF